MTQGCPLRGLAALAVLGLFGAVCTAEHPAGETELKDPKEDNSRLYAHAVGTRRPRRRCAVCEILRGAVWVSDQRRALRVGQRERSGIRGPHGSKRRWRLSEP